MSYTPLNVNTFVAALSGSLAGIGIGERPITSTNPTDYNGLALAAFAYAQEFDTQWGSSAPDTLEWAAILSASQGYWNSRDKESHKATDYTNECAAIIAAIREGDAVAIAEGVSIPVWPPGGGSGANASEFQGVPISATPHPPGQSDVYVYDMSTSEFDLRQLTADDIAPGFAITSFSGGSTVEVGATVTNPPFAALYSATPTSASITNTDGVDSPLVLTTPFAAGTVVGAFTHAVLTAVTFTLTAILGAITKTASTAINFFPRSFAGLATAGATSATAAGTTAVLNGGDGTLTNAGLNSSVVGQTFGPFAPASQKIDILVPHTATPHTWKDPSTGFAFAMNAPTTFAFTNANGAVLSMDLYESTNILIASAQSVQCVT
jgi:hypothetical protein